MGVSVSELKAKLSEHLRRVKAGEEVLVTDRGRAVARLVPVRPAADDSRLAALEEAGLVRRGTGQLPQGWLHAEEPCDPDASVRRAVGDERESGW